MGLFDFLFGNDDDKDRRNYVESKHKNPNEDLLNEKCIYIQGRNGLYKKRDGGWTDDPSNAGKFSYQEWQFHNAYENAKRVKFKFGWLRIGHDDDEKEN